MSDDCICIGDIRGWCGIVHSSLKAAQKCCNQDGKACFRKSGMVYSYSDRAIHYCDCDLIERTADGKYIYHSYKSSEIKCTCEIYKYA